jgi:putative DNA primase/helicase
MAATDIDFREIAITALAHVPEILDHLQINHRRAGLEIEMINPTRDDRRFGSFRISTRSGSWSDFATGDTGCDVISLVAYVCGCRQIDAARRIG